jgi:hypothetical protein
MLMKSENTPLKKTIKQGEIIELNTRFGSLSRGKCWGKCYPNQTRPKGEFVWVDKSQGTLYLDQPGYYIVGSGDGFNRSAKSEFVLTLEQEHVSLEKRAAMEYGS